AGATAARRLRAGDPRGRRAGSRARIGRPIDKAGGPRRTRGGDALRRDPGHRHRHRDFRSSPRTHLRSLLHHEGGGIGARPGDRAPHRGRKRGPRERRECRRARHVLPCAPADRGEPAMSRILVVDDERSMREVLAILLRKEGYEVATAGDVDGAMLALESDDYDLVISDIQMPGKSGLDLLKAIRAAQSDALVVMITASATTETAISAMKEGAYDYVTKPFKVDEIKLVIQKALEKKVLATENARLRSELRSERRERQLVGNSAPMQQVYEMVGRIATTKTNVLIVGESGTGKEVVARAIHTESDRAEMPFVALNCAAIPENLLESELFGHVKGAFTGAVNNKPGLFEAADNGTLFLDEVGELSLPLQVKLLRAIQEKTIRRVGGTSDRRVDVRIVAATNRRLEDEVAANR